MFWQGIFLYVGLSLLGCASGQHVLSGAIGETEVGLLGTGMDIDCRMCNPDQRELYCGMFPTLCPHLTIWCSESCGECLPISPDCSNPDIDWRRVCAQPDYDVICDQFPYLCSVAPFICSVIHVTEEIEHINSCYNDTSNLVTLLKCHGLRLELPNFCQFGSQFGEELPENLCDCVPFLCNKEEEDGAALLAAAKCKPSEPAFTCRSTAKGTEYTGPVSTTEKGITCQRWDSQEPQEHRYGGDPSNFPDNTIADASNYCRNPDSGSGGPWCYTTDPNVRWQSCDIDYCSSDTGCTDTYRKLMESRLLKFDWDTLCEPGNDLICTEFPDLCTCKNIKCELMKQEQGPSDTSVRFGLQQGSSYQSFFADVDSCARSTDTLYCRSSDRREQVPKMLPTKIACQLGCPKLYAQKLITPASNKLCEQVCSSDSRGSGSKIAQALTLVPLAGSWTCEMCSSVCQFVTSNHWCSMCHQQCNELAEEADRRPAGYGKTSAAETAVLYLTDMHPKGQAFRPERPWMTHENIKTKGHRSS